MKKNLIIAVITLLEVRILYYIHSQNFDLMLSGITNFFQGTCHFPAFQSRILGPGIIHLIALSGLSLKTSYIIFWITLLYVANILCYQIISPKNNAINYTIGFSGLFLALQWSGWLYPWDSIELIIMLLFAYGIFERKSTKFLVVVFAIGIFNRESALFIPLWIISNSITAQSINNKRTIALGISLFAIGISITTLLRYLLFKKALFVYESLSGFGNNFELSNNILRIHPFNFPSDIITFLCTWAILISFFVLNYLFLKTYLQIETNLNHVKISVLLIGIMAFVFLVAVVTETRQYIMFIPFALFMIRELVKANCEILTDSKEG